MNPLVSRGRGGLIGAATGLTVLALVIASAPCRAVDESAGPPEPPVRLRKKAKLTEQVPENKPETKLDDKAKEQPADKAVEPPQLRRPTGDDNPEPPMPGADPREILGRVSNNMRDVEELLGKHDAGTGTQQKQRDVVSDLDKLIELQQQQQQQQQASNHSSSEEMRRQQRQQRAARQQQQAQKQQQQQQREQAAQINANQPGAAGRSAGANRIADLYKDIWGHLPETMRQEMDAYSREQFMAKYHDLLKKYYSTLAEKGRRPGD